MLVDQLNLDTRSRLYTLTKKVLRKYQKGIISGKLTSDKFVENMLCDRSVIELLDPDIVDQEEFVLSYKEYVEKLIKIQNDTLRNCKRKKGPNINKVEVSIIIELKKQLQVSGYKLKIPYQYLTDKDIRYIMHYLKTGEIELGNERIYNYLSR